MRAMPKVRDADLLPCPFCGAAMMLRDALWPSEGDTDGILHAAPTDCPLPEFSTSTADECASVAAAWNKRAAQEWQDISTHGPWDGQPYRQFIRIEGSRDHHGANWARVYCGEAFVRPPGAEDGMLGYRREDIIRLCDHGDIDIHTATVTHWMPVSFPPVAVIADHRATGDNHD